MNPLNNWQDIKAGETIRLRNSSGEELDRDIISVDAKYVVYHRHEAEGTSKIATATYMRVYNRLAVPYPHVVGDLVEARE